MHFIERNKQNRKSNNIHIKVNTRSSSEQTSCSLHACMCRRAEQTKKNKRTENRLTVCCDVRVVCLSFGSIMFFGVSEHKIKMHRVFVCALVCVCVCAFLFNRTKQRVVYATHSGSKKNDILAAQSSIYTAVTIHS